MISHKYLLATNLNIFSRKIVCFMENGWHTILAALTKEFCLQKTRLHWWHFFYCLNWPYLVLWIFNLRKVTLRVAMKSLSSFEKAFICQLLCTFSTNSWKLTLHFGKSKPKAQTLFTLYLNLISKSKILVI